MQHCHHQNDVCVKMGSDENHFMVSLIVRGKVTVFEERRAEAELNQGPFLPVKNKTERSESSGHHSVQLEGTVD